MPTAAKRNRHSKLFKRVTGSSGPRGTSKNGPVTEIRREDFELEHRALLKTQKDLETSRERYAELYDSAPVGYVTLSRSGVIQEINLAGAQLLGFRPADLPGFPFAGFVARSCQRKFLQHLAHVQKHSHRTSVELELAGKDGKPSARVELVTGPFATNDTTRTDYPTALIDITARRNAEKLLHDSEYQYRQLVQGLSAAIYTTDAEGRILLYNQAAVDLWGREPELGKESWCGSWRIYRTDGTVLPFEECPMAITLREGRPVRGAEIVVERPDGERRNVAPHPELIRDASGKITGAINMLVDITDRKQAEEARQRLAAIVESSNDAIVSKNLDGVISSWNEGATRLFGYVADEVIGKPITILIPKDRQDEETAIIQRIRQGERIDHYETMRQRKDGRLVEISLTVSPIKDTSGKVIGASKIARDITERRQAEQKLEESFARERAANQLLAEQATGMEWQIAQRTASLKDTIKSLENVCYTIAHDLRGPLRSMAGFSQLLLDDHAAALEERGKDYARRIAQSAVRLDRLIEDLLEYGRLSQSHLPCSTVALENCINLVLAQVAMDMASQGGDVEIRRPLPEVRGHPVVLQQVLVNLIGNALKFVAAGVAPVVRVWAEAKADTVRIWVEDNGIGVPPGQHEKIFGLFQRMSDNHPGTGLGLAIVRKGMEQMNGCSGVESQLGEGSRFWIELPKAE